MLAYKYFKKRRDQRKQQGALPADPAAVPDAAVPDAGTSAAHEDVVEEEDPVEKKRRRKYRWKVLFGLMMPFALQALDTTIIASALPFIATDFGESTSSTPHFCFFLFSHCPLPFVTIIIGRPISFPEKIWRRISS